MKVYIPALFEEAHKTFNHVIGLTETEDVVSYPISLEMAEKYFDVVTDKVEGSVITRVPVEE